MLEPDPLRPSRVEGMKSLPGPDRVEGWARADAGRFPVPGLGRSSAREPGGGRRGLAGPRLRAGPHVADRLGAGREQARRCGLAGGLRPDPAIPFRFRSLCEPQQPTPGFDSDELAFREDPCNTIPNSRREMCEPLRNPAGLGKQPAVGTLHREDKLWQHAVGRQGQGGRARASRPAEPGTPRS